MSGKNNIIELLSSDDEDDALMVPTVSVFARRPLSNTGTKSNPHDGANTSSVSSATANAFKLKSDPGALVETPIGHIDFSFVSNSYAFNAGDVVDLKLSTNIAAPKTIEIYKSSSKQLIGTIAHNDATLLAPILKQCVGDKVGYRSVLFSVSSYPKTVRVNFVGRSAARLSKFELQPIEKQIQFYLKSKKSLVKAPPPPPRYIPQAPAAAVAVAATTSADVKPEPKLSITQGENNVNQSDSVTIQQNMATTKLGTWTCFVSGTRQLKGRSIQEGTMVQLVREPDNRHDKNAIRVDHNGSPMGYIRSDEAMQLSPILHSGGANLTYECKILSKDSVATKQLGLSFWHTTRMAVTFQKLLEYHLKGFSKDLLTVPREKVPKMHVSNAMPDLGDLNLLLAGPNCVELSEEEWLQAKDALDEIFDEQSRAQLSNLPDYPMPALFERNNVVLYEHQKAGIRWLIHQEQQENPSYIESNPGRGMLWECKITKTKFKTRPEPMRGGILADDMGLGKTLQTLGLILTNPPTGVSYPRSNRSIGGNRKDVPICTLIVSPLSVMGNWYQQIFQHVNGRSNNKNITLAKYHGASRENMLVRVQQGQVDVLMASYHTLAADFRVWKEALEEDSTDLSKALATRLRKKPRKAPYIFDLEFHRVILDEAHIVRNSKSTLWKAVMQLCSARKLCLTGTPFVNNPSDIRSLLRFLNVQPLSDEKVFNKLVATPIKERREIGLQTVRATMAHIALRRKKEQVMADINLVTKQLTTIKISFLENSDHCEVHQTLYSTARSYFLHLLNSKEKKVNARFMEILALVLRIRQSCCHLALVPEDYVKRAREQMEHSKNRVEGIGREEGEELLEFLNGAFKESKLVECAICMDEMEEESAVILRSCKHIFCEACLNQIQTSTCPMCRQEYTPDDMITKHDAKAASESFSAKKGLEKHGRSPKIQALFDCIESLCPDEKAVIFSQWTSVLDIVALEFETYGYTYTRIDGRMNADERIDAMMRFDTEGCNTLETPRFILCSMMACGTGINLTRGNVVFMMDTWWNRAAENQAMDRVHRIGQKRPVRVYRMVMKDSIEERMIQLQTNKLMLAKGSMEKFSNEEEKQQARLTALKDLFGVVACDGCWR